MENYLNQFGKIAYTKYNNLLQNIKQNKYNRECICIFDELKNKIMAHENTEEITTGLKKLILNTRQKALIWWDKMNLEERFYKTIEYNDIIQGDCTRHPDTLTGSEIEVIYIFEL